MRRGLVLMAAVLVLAAAPACGGGGKTDEAARAAGITPIDAVAFLTVSLDPSIEQKRNLMSIAKAFPGAKVKDEFEQSRDELLDQMLEGSGLDYSDDVKPWLGDEVAVLALPGPGPDAVPTAVVMIEVDDREKAEAALKKAAAKEPEIGEYRFIDDFVVMVGRGQEGGKAALDAVDAQAKSDKPGLADAAKFKNVIDELHGDRLVLGWVDSQRLGEMIAEGMRESLPVQFDFAKQLAGAGPVAIDLHAANKAIVLEAVGKGAQPSKGGQPRLTEALPAATLAALTAFDLGGGLTSALAQMTAGTNEAPNPEEAFKEATGLDLNTDILSWMGGEVTLAVGPPPGEELIPDFALVVEPTDRAKAEAAVPRIRAAISQEIGEEAFVEQQIAGATAYVLTEPVQDTVQPAMALFSDRFVIASRPAYLAQLATKSASSLAESAAYKSVVDTASSGKTQFQFLLRIDPVRELLEKAFEMQDDAEYNKDVKPNLVPLDVLGMRSYRLGEWDRFEVKLTVS